MFVCGYYQKVMDIFLQLDVFTGAIEFGQYY